MRLLHDIRAILRAPCDKLEIAMRGRTIIPRAYGHCAIFMLKNGQLKPWVLCMIALQPLAVPVLGLCDAPTSTGLRFLIFWYNLELNKILEVMATLQTCAILYCLCADTACK